MTWYLFGPLILLKLIYVIYHLCTYNLYHYRGESAEQLSHEFNILDNSEGWPHENQKPDMYDDFLKNVYTSIGSSVENLNETFQVFMKKN